jgi:FAD linked oxidases, C-terminal domain.
VLFADFADAVQASRELAQSGLNPANCRLLGHDEALMSGSGDGSQSILVLGFESADHELGPWLARALEICAAIAARPVVSRAAGTATRPRPGGLRSCAAGTCATAWSGSG